VEAASVSDRSFAVHARCVAKGKQSRRRVTPTVGAARLIPATPLVGEKGLQLLGDVRGAERLVRFVGASAPAPRFHCESLPAPKDNWQ